jgi:uncharacterized protein
MTAPARRMDEAAIARLEDLLERHAVPHDGMSLEMLDGFLSALLVGPEDVPAAEYLPRVWNREPGWTWADERREAEALIEQLTGDILWRITRDLPDEDDESPQAYAELDAVMPLLAMPPEEDIDPAADDPYARVDPGFPLGAAWAFGFLSGVRLRDAAWHAWAEQDPQIDDDLGDLLQLSLVDPEQVAEMGLEDAEIPDFSQRMGMVSQLPYVLQDIQAWRLEQLRPAPARRAELPGRNDPCPCGSGQKFKKCCGAPGRLN